MRNKLFVFTLFFLLLASFWKVTAQENALVEVQTSLNIDEVYESSVGMCEDYGFDCLPYPAGKAHPMPGLEDHEMLLTTSGLTPGLDVYIVGCVNSPEGQSCTTGDSSLDALLNSTPGGNQLVPPTGLQFKALENPVKVDAEGVASTIVRSFTEAATEHLFEAHYLQNESEFGDPNAIEITDTPEEFNENALHLTNFGVSVVPTKPPKKPVRVFRPKILNDPKGRLFDSRSLEPIVRANVTLLDAQKKLFEHKNITNPQTVKKNGEFNFFVPNGLYYLSFSLLESAYNWPLDLTTVNPRYNLAFFCDPEVKNELGQTVALYDDEHAIYEQDKLVHCDVPVYTGNAGPVFTKLESLDYGYYRINGEKAYNFSGKLTHPLANVKLVGALSKKVVATTEADRLGYWSIRLLESAFPQTDKGAPEKLNLVLTKKNISGLEEFKAEEITAQSFEPILSYLEGFAYDAAGRVLPFAEVGVQQHNSLTPFFLTAADERGFFQVPSKYLPTIAYQIVFRSKGGKNVDKIATSEFATQNAEYTAAQELNLLSTVKNEVKTVKADIATLNATPTRTPNKAETAKTATKSGFSPVILIVLLVALFGGIVAVVASRKGRAESLPTEKTL